MDSELYLNAPEGYPIVARIKKSDTLGLKSFLIGMSLDDRTQDMIREMSHEEVVNTCLANNFTFDPEWYGYRELKGSL